MAWPIYGEPISTKYGKRGPYWSCQPDSSGNGVHTGVDIACPSGTPIYAPISGEIRHRSYGSAFGSHQFVISPDPGEPFANGEVFFAHTRTRLADGTRVTIGQKIAEVGAEGNVTGPHLHLELHADSKASWSCSVHDDPQPALEHMPTGQVYVSKLVWDTNDSDSVRRLQRTLNGIPLDGGSELQVTGNYQSKTANEVALWQQQEAYDQTVTDGRRITPEQAAQLFATSGDTVTDDTAPTPEPPDPPEPPQDVTYPLGIQYHYSGKPEGTLTVTGTYKRLDVASWAPKNDGYTLGMIYANVDGSGEFRTRLIREPHAGDGEDPTAYQTHYPKSGDNYLLTHVWFEKGEAGRPLHYELQTMDGETITLGTRYAKFLTIPEEVVVALAEVSAAYLTIRRPLRGLIRWLAQAVP